MRGIKPYKVGFITRTFEWNRTYQFGISTFIYFPFAPEGTLYTDLEMWEFAGNALPPGTVLEQGIPKSRAEFLVVGSAYVPGGQPAPTCPVKVEIGSRKKTLYVIGDRVWDKGVPTAPQPFTQMPLDWSRAFGGEGYEKNPLGKGAAPIKGEDGRPVHPLPNMEIPGHLVTSPKDRPEPAGFGAIDFTWPQRFSHAGTYDRAWFENLYPGYAPDMDWRIWNAAPEDQRQDEVFRGDETMAFENMHPTKARVTGCLPGVRCRAFIVRAGREPLEEVPLRPLTIWAFPAEERGILVFQGATQVMEDDAHDVAVVMVVAERMDEPRSLEHYWAAYQKRLDPARLAECLDESDIVPPDLVGFGPEIERHLELTTPKGHRATLIKETSAAEVARVRAELESLGLDPDVHGPAAPPVDEPVPNAAELARMAVEKKVEAEKLREEASVRREAALADIEPFYKEKGLDFAELKQELAEIPGGPPAPTADERRETIRKLADDLKEMGHPIDELQHYLDDPSFYEQWKKGDAMALESYRGAAHFTGPVRPNPEKATRARAFVERALAEGQSLAEQDLTGADLSGMSLAGADFSRALLEAASLRGSDLSGAKMDAAVLAHADLSGTLLEGCSFRDANLGKAKLVGAESRESVDFTRAVLWGAALDRARLVGAKLTGAALMEATFEETDLSKSTATEIMFYKSRLTGAKLIGIEWRNVAFIEVEADGIDLSGCTLLDSTFVKWRATGARFVNANLKGARCVLECVMDGAVMTGATLDSACLRGVWLRGADLSGAKLNGADLSEARLTQARLYRAVARDSMWVRTDLSQAQLVSADLFNAILQKADIRGADFRGANLYGADFALVRGDGATRIEDAIMDKLRARPRRLEGS